MTLRILLASRARVIWLRVDPFDIKPGHFEAGPACEGVDGRVSVHTTPNPLHTWANGSSRIGLAGISSV
jgi:hypothetical protein